MLKSWKQLRGFFDISAASFVFALRQKDVEDLRTQLKASEETVKTVQDERERLETQLKDAAKSSAAASSTAEASQRQLLESRQRKEDEMRDHVASLERQLEESMLAQRKLEEALEEEGFEVSKGSFPSKL